MLVRLGVFFWVSFCGSESRSVRLFATPWTKQSMNSPGQNTGVGSCSLLQGIFLTQGSNPGLLHCRWILHQLSHQGSPRILEWVAYPFSRGSAQPGINPGSPALKADSFFFFCKNPPASADVDLIPGAGRFFTSWTFYWFTKLIRMIRMLLTSLTGCLLLLNKSTNIYLG